MPNQHFIPYSVCNLVTHNIKSSNAILPSLFVYRLMTELKFLLLSLIPIHEDISEQYQYSNSEAWINSDRGTLYELRMNTEQGMKI